MFKGLRFTLDLPPIWLGGFAAMTWALATYVPVLTFDVSPVGSVIIWCGILVIAWAAVWFWRKDTPIEPGNVPDSLIVEGPYKISRNPIYVGLSAILWGFAVNQGTFSALLPAVIYPFVIQNRFILHEEECLRETFGDDAEDFFNSTRRWLF